MSINSPTRALTAFTPVFVFLIILSASAFAADKVDAGEDLYNSKCSTCHGAKGVGTRMGPPLVHKIYEPNHHGDMSFVMAVRRGVGAHHWRFGNMPKIKGLDNNQIKTITKYVRKLQKEAGIY